MNRVIEKIINIAKDTKFLFLVIFIVASTLLLEFNYRRSEESLMRELRAAQARREQLQTRLDRTLEKITPLKEEIAPLKEEIDNLRKIVLIEKAMGEIQTGNPAGAQGNIAWELPAGSIAPRPLPDITAIDSISLPGEDTAGAVRGIARLKDYIKEIEEQNATLKKSSDDLDRQLNEKEEDLARLGKDNLALKEDLKDALKAQEELKEEMNIQASRLGIQLADRERETGELLKIKSDFEGRITELNNKINELMQINSRLEQQLSLKDKDNSSLQREISGMKDEAARQKAYAEGLEAKISQAKEEISGKEKEIDELSRESAQLREFKRSAEKELVELRSVNAGQDGLMRKIEELGLSIREKEGEINKSRDEIASLGEKMAAILRQRDTLLSDLKGKDKVIAGLRSDLISAADSQQKNIKRLIEFQKSNIALRQALAGFAQELELLKLEKGTVR